MGYLLTSPSRLLLPILPCLPLLKSFLLTGSTSTHYFAIALSTSLQGIPSHAVKSSTSLVPCIFSLPLLVSILRGFGTNVDSSPNTLASQFYLPVVFFLIPSQLPIPRIMLQILTWSITLPPKSLFQESLSLNLQCPLSDYLLPSFQLTLYHPHSNQNLHFHWPYKLFSAHLLPCVSASFLTRPYCPSLVQFL